VQLQPFPRMFVGPTIVDYRNYNGPKVATIR
jgi:hypothetical protein